eukprot:TRINITY_DN19491_c0_g1_i1.p1 TRINITY_DN19491_c0_g1~~TRINITY_DN19491_c0_g1_i1.p1  ORF type:complete len:335 (-),score=47.00 TRINITY_DN19491_c0_g1_i1:75-1079(-)
MFSLFGGGARTPAAQAYTSFTPGQSFRSQSFAGGFAPTQSFAGGVVPSQSVFGGSVAGGVVSTQYVDRQVEVPQIQTFEKIVEVPQITYQEVEKWVPKIEHKEIVVPVPRRQVEYVEKVVEVPQIHQIIERDIPVPKIEYQEIVREVPRPQIMFTEKIVEVPEVREYQTFVDAPYVETEEVVKHVPKVQYEYLRADGTMTGLAGGSYAATPVARSYCSIERSLCAMILLVIFGGVGYLSWHFHSEANLRGSEREKTVIYEQGNSPTPSSESYSSYAVEVTVTPTAVPTFEDPGAVEVTVMPTAVPTFEDQRVGTDGIAYTDTDGKPGYNPWTDH